jgi:hypothetical protein
MRKRLSGRFFIVRRFTFTAPAINSAPAIITSNEVVFTSGKLVLTTGTAALAFGLIIGLIAVQSLFARTERALSSTESLTTSSAPAVNPWAGFDATDIFRGASSCWNQTSRPSEMT